MYFVFLFSKMSCDTAEAQNKFTTRQMSRAKFVITALSVVHYHKNVLLYVVFLLFFSIATIMYIKYNTTLMIFLYI